MKYAASTLLSNEKIVYFTRPSKIIFAQSFFIFLAGLIFLPLDSAYSLLGWIFILVAFLEFLITCIGYFCSEYVITDKRILIKVGFIARKSFEIFLHRLEGISVSQSIIGRIFNFGTVVIGGIGGSQDPFYYIPDPIKFRRAAQEQMETASKII